MPDEQTQPGYEGAITMEDNYIMLNGKKLPLTEEQVKLLTEDDKPFDRGNVGDVYYFIDDFGVVRESADFMNEYDDRLFAVANACRDEEIMKRRAMHETLNRLLWRYSEQHGGDAEWNNENGHYCIAVIDCTVQINFYVYRKMAGTVYFKDRDTAQAAIEDVVEPFLAEHPDFVW